MIIDNSGNVGIGTTSPGGMIHIYNPSSTGAELILDTVSNAVASGIRFQVGGTFLGNISYSPASDGIIIGGGDDQSDSLFVQRNTEYVGIGTVTPQGQLHVYNPSPTGAELILDTVNTATASAVQFQMGGVHKGLSHTVLDLIRCLLK